MLLSQDLPHAVRGVLRSRDASGRALVILLASMRPKMLTLLAHCRVVQFHFAQVASKITHWSLPPPPPPHHLNQLVRLFPQHNHLLVALGQLDTVVGQGASGYSSAVDSHAPVVCFS